MKSKIKVPLSRDFYQGSYGITEFLEGRDKGEIIFIVLHFKCESLPRRILEFARENYLYLDQVWSNLRSVAPRGLLYKPRESSTLHFSFYMVRSEEPRAPFFV